MPRTEECRRAPRDGCIAREMRKANRATRTVAGALLLSWGLRLLVRHVRDHAARDTATIPLTLVPAHGVRRTLLAAQESAGVRRLQGTNLSIEPGVHGGRDQGNAIRVDVSGLDRRDRRCR